MVQSFNRGISFLGSAYINTSLLELEQALDSILSNTIPPDEIILVFDGPVVDDVHSIKFNTKYSGVLKVISLHSNVGLGSALNIGFQHCHGHVVFRFDTDDLCSRFRVVRTLNFLASYPSVDIVGSSVFEFSVSNESLRYRLKKVPLSNSQISTTMMVRNPLNHPSVAFRSGVFTTLGGYQDDLYFEDYGLWLRARALGFVFANIDSPLVFMRRPDAALRRKGLIYLKSELKFFIKYFSRSSYSLEFLFFFFLRFTSRLIPGFLQGFQNYLPWRSKWLSVKLPSGSSPLQSLENLASAICLSGR